MKAVPSSLGRTCRALLATLAHGLLANAASAQAPQLANPASQNCVTKGGKVVIETNPRGGQFGVCMFDDNMQCEEWAMMRGQCRTGGIKVTGYATAAARYCAITGGTYMVTAGSNTPTERGNCTFPNGKKCTAAAYYNGTCTRQVAATRTADGGAAPAPVQRIQAVFNCAGGKSIDATFINAKSSSVQLAFSDGRRMTLPQTMSGSGARYASKGDKVVFWNKGNTAFVEEGGKTTYADCATKS